MQDMSLHLLTSSSLSDEAEGVDLFRCLCEEAPDLAPEHYGSCQPYKEKFRCADVNGAIKSTWQNRTFLWNRKTPKSEGGVWQRFGKANIHGSVDIWTESARTDVPNVVRFFKRAAARLGVDFGLIHLLNDVDIVRGRPTGTILGRSRKDATLAISTHKLRKFIPELYWATIFGPPYVKLFGKQRLMSSPAYVVEEIAPDTIYIQLSHSILDLQAVFDEVDAARQSVKVHLDSDAFYDPDKGASGVYNVPRFQLADN